MSQSAEVMILAAVAIAVIVLVYTVSVLVRKPREGDVGLTEAQKYHLSLYQKWYGSGAQQGYAQNAVQSNYCPYCGGKDHQGAFCAYCGKKLR